MIATHIRKWGNSLAVRFPQSVLEQLGLQENGKVEITVENGRIILAPAKKHTLEELLAGITPENKHGEIDFGTPVGREIW